MYTTLPPEESLRFLKEKAPAKEAYRYVGHSFVLMKFGKSVCSRCGLISLKNDATEWCIEKGCMYKEHPAYPNVLNKYWRKYGQ